MSKKEKIIEEEEEFLDDEFEVESGRKLSDWVRKAINTGVGAVFSTEEGIRNVLGEMKLSGEMISSVINSVDKTKKELAQVVGREIRGFLEKVEIHDLIKKSLAGATFEINAKIRIVPAPKNQIGFSKVTEEEHKSKKSPYSKRPGPATKKTSASIGLKTKAKRRPTKKRSDYIEIL